MSNQYNSLAIHDSQNHYVVNHEGKNYDCQRVTNVLEANSPTPFPILKWMVNEAVSYTILDPITTDIKEIKKDAWNAHKVLSEQALVVGSQVHNAIHHNDEASLTSDEARACFRGYKEFVADFLPVRLAGELSIYNTSKLVAGTIDWLGLSVKDTGKKKSLWLIDWKTSQAIQRNYKIQLTVYKWMLSNFIQDYVRNPINYDQNTTRILNTIIEACGKKPKIKLKIVRLDKNKDKKNKRSYHQVCDITAQEEKVFLAEFKLMLKINQHRRKQDAGSNVSK